MNVNPLFGLVKSRADPSYAVHYGAARQVPWGKARCKSCALLINMHDGKGWRRVVARWRDSVFERFKMGGAQAS
jgi:hypothetical protein